MAGGNHPKGSTHKSRWEESTINKPPSNDPTPIPKPPNPPPDPPHLSKPDPTPPAAPLPYGFHMLDRRTFVHFDGSVISYFALPPNYPDFGPLQRPGPAFSGPGIRFGPEFRDRGQDCWNLLGVDGRGGENSAKRKFGEERERDWREEKEGRGLNPSGFPMGVEFLPEIGGGDELRAAKYMRLGGGGYENKYFDAAQVP